MPPGLPQASYRMHWHPTVSGLSQETVKTFGIRSVMGVGNVTYGFWKPNKGHDQASPVCHQGEQRPMQIQIHSVLRSRVCVFKVRGGFSQGATWKVQMPFG